MKKLTTIVKREDVENSPDADLGYQQASDPRICEENYHFIYFLIFWKTQKGETDKLSLITIELNFYM